MTPRPILAFDAFLAAVCTRVPDLDLEVVRTNPDTRLDFLGADSIVITEIATTVEGLAYGEDFDGNAPQIWSADVTLRALYDWYVSQTVDGFLS